MLICQLYILFDEASVEVFGPFFNWVVCYLIVVFLRVLGILANSPLSDVFFVNIFSQSVAFLLIHLIFL